MIEKFIDSFKVAKGNIKREITQSFAVVLLVHNIQAGRASLGLLGAVLGVAITLMVLSTAIPVIWPLAANTTAIDAMTGTDAGTTTFQAFWPVVLLVVGLGMAIGVLVYGLRKFKMGGIGGL